MGEAKKKREALKDMALLTIEKWGFPATSWEAATVAEIESLPRVKASRVSTQQLAQMRMPPKQCHKNASFLEENDPEGKNKHITGWWPQDGNYVLHSVILREGEYYCVTPLIIEDYPIFDFIPDPKIEWRDEGDVRSAFRDGVKIGEGVRSDPARTIAQGEFLKDSLARGMNPMEAFKAATLIGT